MDEVLDLRTTGGNLGHRVSEAGAKAGTELRSLLRQCSSLALELCLGGDIGEGSWSLQNERDGWREEIIGRSIVVPFSHIIPVPFDHGAKEGFLYLVSNTQRQIGPLRTSETFHVPGSF